MTSSSDCVLFDTNILIYSQNKDSSFFGQAKELVTKVQRGGVQGVLAHQNLLEFYSIVTNPKRISFPLTLRQAKDEINNYLASGFMIISPNERTLPLFVDLLGSQQIKDREVFDCYLAATMLSSNIKKIYTVNISDFDRYEGIEVMNPFAEKK